MEYSIEECVHTRKTRISSSRTVYNVIYSVMLYAVLARIRLGVCPLVRRATDFSNANSGHIIKYSPALRNRTDGRACVHNNAHKIPNDPSMSSGVIEWIFHCDGGGVRRVSSCLVVCVHVWVYLRRSWALGVLLFFDVLSFWSCTHFNFICFCVCECFLLF